MKSPIEVYLTHRMFYWEYGKRLHGKMQFDFELFFIGVKYRWKAGVKK